MNKFDKPRELRSENDFDGPISDIIKVVRACEKAGIQVKDVINVLRRPDKKEVLREINEFSFQKSQAEMELKKKLEQEERARDFGIGAYLNKE